MVGLLLVSHSRSLVEGLAEMVAQIAGPVPIAAVGGTADGRLGTDPTAIHRAIEELWSPDGLLILVDLGSSIMAAETALELLPPERSAHVLLSRAPLVEGAVTAGVESLLGHSLAQVAAAAEATLQLPKF